MIGQVTFVGDLREVPSKNELYTQPLLVRGVVISWFVPRSGQQGITAEAETCGFELRNALAVDCRLQVGDLICFDYSSYGSHYTDKDGHEVSSTRLTISRYAFVSEWVPVSHQ